MVPCSLPGSSADRSRQQTRALPIFILVVPTFTLFSELLPLTEYYLFFAGYALFWWFVTEKGGGARAAQI